MQLDTGERTELEAALLTAACTLQAPTRTAPYWATQAQHVPCRVEDTTAVVHDAAAPRGVVTLQTSRVWLPGSTAVDEGWRVVLEDAAGSATGRKLGVIDVNNSTAQVLVELTTQEAQ
jgi:hypothetical protein